VNVVDISVLYSSAQAICCNISLVQGEYRWVHSFVYGSNNGVERRELWQDWGWFIIKLLRLLVF
jgi:hypothetical protein